MFLAAPGLEAMAHPEYLPFRYPPGIQRLQFSSYDLSGGNNDGNFDGAFTKYINNNGEAEVFVDGVNVERPWHVVFNSWAPANQA